VPQLFHKRRVSCFFALLRYGFLTDLEKSYFVSNRSDRAESLDATFRVAGKAVELWRADTGLIQPASYAIHGRLTTVPLKLEPYDALFVVFDKPASVPEYTTAEPVRVQVAKLQDAWTVSFQPNRGAPAGTHFAALRDWSQNPDPGIKYFSGTATYTQTIKISTAAFKSGARFELDLGSVREVAGVVVNGQPSGTAWKPPYRVDVTRALKPGMNTFTIEVTNLWPNRLIGDKQPGAKRVAFASIDAYAASSPLLPSGLLGPVELFRVDMGAHRGD
jgi:alpha-L-rhamnosidase